MLAAESRTLEMGSTRSFAENNHLQFWPQCSRLKCVFLNRSIFNRSIFKLITSICIFGHSPHVYLLFLIRGQAFCNIMLISIVIFIISLPSCLQQLDAQTILNQSFIIHIDKVRENGPWCRITISNIASEGRVCPQDRMLILLLYHDYCWLLLYYELHEGIKW